MNTPTLFGLLACAIGMFFVIRIASIAFKRKTTLGKINDLFRRERGFGLTKKEKERMKLFSLQELQKELTAKNGRK